MSLDHIPADQLIYYTFDAIRRAVISAADIQEIRAFDSRLFEVLRAVASSEVTLFPGLADVRAAIDDEVHLTEAESTAIGDTLRQGMHLDREIAQRLLTFLAGPKSDLQ
jgi:hypothetical protein